MTKQQLIELVKFTAGEIVAPTTLNDEDAESIVDDFVYAERLTIPVVSGILPTEEYHIKQLKLYGVVVNEAKTIDKQTQEKLIIEMMKADEALGLYSEVELVCNRINDNNANRCITCGVKAGHPCGLQTN